MIETLVSPTALSFHKTSMVASRRFPIVVAAYKCPGWSFGVGGQANIVHGAGTHLWAGTHIWAWPYENLKRGYVGPHLKATTSSCPTSHGYVHTAGLDAHF
ncbi:hypothetical protein XENORESO_007551 [Xenotaenia resolanae]|uniref:Uncharacterized protein n=1 Tax=Xenotaenia resolanae TaxID=208358 RepID=A0ABV0WVY7_9TELE